ncbi:hypothetical protein [Hutsoniella sourekii]|uniref:hypothetical protein n=1 Tax=Hutsoniella sourekii TaxID=87650 RepID=UPI00048995EB|nr:hypothetical protein [Hutsoniella sourekii]
MITNLKRFKLPFICFLLVVIIAGIGMTPYWSAKINHFLFLLGLFHLTARNLSSQLGPTRPIKGCKALTKWRLAIICYLIPFLSALIIIGRATVSNYGDVHDSYYVALILGLVVFNFIFAITKVDLRESENLRQLGAFILKMFLVMVPIIVLYFLMGISIAKDFNSINRNRYLNQLLAMGLLPLLTTLVLPRFTGSKQRSWLTWLGGVPLLMVVAFLILAWVQPTPYNPSQYIAYLEERGLWSNGHIQKNANFDLTIPERKDLVYYTKAMSTMNLPEELAVINQYYENPYHPSVEGEAAFIESFGYSPESLLTNSQPLLEFPIDDQRILLKPEERDKILQDQVSQTELITVDWSDYLYDGKTNTWPIEIEDQHLTLEDSFQANPDRYILTLKDDHGQVLTRVSLLDLIEARRQSDHNYLPADQLVFPFESQDLAGYLSVRELVFDPQTLDNYTHLEFAIKSDQPSNGPNQASYNEEGALNINGQYDAIVSFKSDQFEVQPKDQAVAKKAEETGHRDLIPREMHRKLTLDDQNYLLVVRYDSPHSYLRISISQAGQTLMDLPLEKGDFLVSYNEVSPESIHFSQGDFEIDLLVTGYFKYFGETEGYLFINKKN